MSDKEPLILDESKLHWSSALCNWVAFAGIIK